MLRTIAAVSAAASLASMAGAQVSSLPGVPAIDAQIPSSLFSLSRALQVGNVAPASSPDGVATGTALGSEVADGATELPSVGAANAGVAAATAARSVAGLRPNPEVQAQVENVAGTGAYRGLRGSPWRMPV